MPLPKLKALSMEQTVNFSSPLSWGISDPVRFAELMDEAKKLVAPGYYLGDNLFTWARNNSALEDETFKHAWETNIVNDADEAILWRRHILACAAYHCIQLPGDFVECGVYIGTGIKTVMDYLGGVNFPKPYWGYDTFDYNPVEGHEFAGQQEGFFGIVQDRFAEYEQVRLVKGFIPDCFEQGIPEQIAFLHIDLNNADGEIAALEHLFHRVVSGGVVVLDDYEWSGIYRNQKRREDMWFEERDYRVIPYPTGQGMLIKR